MSVVSPVSMPPEKPKHEEQPEAGTQVYAIHGADPEVLAYAMAKYSRSALSHEGIAHRDQRPEGGAVPQHLLLPVRPPLHRRPRPHRHRHRAPLAARRHHCRRRDTAGTARSAPPATRTSGRAATLPPTSRATPSRSTLYRETIDFLFADYERFTEEMFQYALPPHTPRARGHEARRLRAHPAGPRLRRRPLPAAARHQHLARPDRQRPHPRNPGLAPALAYP